MVHHNAQKSSDFLNTLYDLSYMINHVNVFWPLSDEIK